MKELKKILNNSLFFILGGILFGAIGVYAVTTLSSQSVYYDNTNSGSTATNVKDALDELSDKSSSWLDPLNTFILDYESAKSNTTGTIFACNNGVCINKDNKSYCMKVNNFNDERYFIEYYGDEVSCTEDDDWDVHCTIDSAFSCDLEVGGSVTCTDLADNSYCHVNYEDYSYYGYIDIDVNCT